MDPSRDRWLNPAAFKQPAPFTFGNTPPYLNVRQPSILNENFALLKDTRITERLTDEFRFEVSNPMNRVVFASPNLDISSPNFSRITGTNHSPRVLRFGMKLIW